MKKLLLSLFCLMLISQIALTQSSLDSGLVAYYPFNGNANDSSVNHNNGTVYNATITTDRFGNPNSAYSFNGTNAYIVASANTLPSTVRSISLWFYANNVTSHPVLFAYGGNGNCAQGTSFMMALNVANSNKYSTISHCSIKDVNAPYTTPPINQWMHWVVVANGTSTKFYLNGLLYKDSAVVYNNTYTPSTNLAFGTGVGWNGIAPYSDANIGYLNGKLDDIRIYNRELSISEILSLYSNQWTLINNGLPSPQNVIAITSNSAYLFAGLDGGGVYRSTNNGDNWSVVNNGFSNLYVKSLLISGTNVFAGMIGGVYISTNNGTNWTLSGVSGDVVSLSSNGTNIFAGTTIGGVFRSTNNGGSWTAVNSGLTNLYVYALISNGTNLFAGTISSGVFFSSNNGANWTAVNTGLTNLNVRSFTSTGTNIFVATQGGGVFLSTNSGGSWTALNTGLTNLNEYSLTSVGTNVFVGNYNGGVFLSTNNGLNWTDKSQGIITTNTIQCLWLTNNYIFAGVYNGGIYRSSLSELINLVPTVPILLSPANGSSNVTLTPTLFWNTVPNTTSYTTQVSPTNTFSFIVDSTTVTTNQRTIPVGKLNIATTYYWRVKANNQYGSSLWSDVWNFFTIITGIQKSSSEIPREYKLYNNYPNPFNPETNIKFDISKNSFTKLIIYNILGKEVTTLVNEYLSAGSYTVKWNANNKVPSGVYFYKITSCNFDGSGQIFSDVKRMILLK